MPSTYAHRRFGTNVLEHLPDELRAQLEQNRELYDIGLHGPDLLFYYHAAKSNPVGALGNAMHEEPGRVFFDGILLHVPAQDAPAGCVWASREALQAEYTLPGAFKAYRKLIV